MKCQYFLPEKKRFCKFDVLPLEGSQFCGLHNPAADRSPCPINSNHTVATDKLEAHVLVCPDRLHDASALPCYRRDVNRGQCPSQRGKRDRSPAPDDTTASWPGIADVLTQYISNSKPQEEIPTAPLNPITAFQSQKHTPQHHGLQELLHHVGALQRNYTFVEMCAGKGAMAAHIREIFSEPGREGERSPPSPRIIAIDRANFRRKKDSASHLERIRIDVADLYLPAVKGFDDPAVTVVAFAKHACGAATDLILRCLTAPELKCNVACIVVALCCHQLCDASAYVGWPHLMRACPMLHDNASRFDELCKCTSWAVDGRSPENKVKIGQMGKQMLNEGRRAFMVACGYDAKLVQYCNTEHSLENVALVCVRSPCKMGERCF